MEEEHNVEFRQVYERDGIKIAGLESTQTYKHSGIFSVMLLVALKCHHCAVELLCRRQIKLGRSEVDDYGEDIGSRIEVKNLDPNGPLGTDDCELKPFRSS